MRGSAARAAAPRPADDAHLAAAAAAEELIAAIGFEARDTGAGRHRDRFQHFAGLRIDAAHIALIAFPGAVPKLAIDPGHAGDDAIAFDGAQDRAAPRIELMDLAGARLSDPQRAFSPGKAGNGA